MSLLIDKYTLNQSQSEIVFGSHVTTGEVVETVFKRRSL